ncbi:hypothetical protein IJG72_03690 [bacterium]|nr:hypothetical protein [bacterium]
MIPKVSLGKYNYVSRNLAQNFSGSTTTTQKNTINKNLAPNAENSFNIQEDYYKKSKIKNAKLTLSKFLELKKTLSKEKQKILDYIINNNIEDLDGTEILVCFKNDSKKGFLIKADEKAKYENKNYIIIPIKDDKKNNLQENLEYKK